MSPRLQRPRHWKRWLVGSVLVLAVLVVGVPYAYIHFIEGSAPDRFHLPAASRDPRPTASGPATVPLTGTWQMSTGSQAGYRVGEILFGQNNTAVGRTTAVTGKLTLDQSNVSAATVVVDLTKVSSDRSQRDHQFQGRIMDTEQFPTATFLLTKPIAFPAIPADGTTITVTAAGNLTLHGATHPARVSLQARRSGAAIEVSGSIPITFATWNIPNPSFGPVSTDDHGLIEFLLTFRHA